MKERKHKCVAAEEEHTVNGPNMITLMKQA